MKIETTEVKRLTIKEVPDLDPISVILEDLGPGRGKITVECYGQAWSSFWPAMGNRTIGEFFCRCDDSYIASNFGNHASRVNDWGKISDAISAHLDEEIFIEDQGDFDAYGDDAEAIWGPDWYWRRRRWRRSRQTPAPISGRSQRVLFLRRA